MNLICNALVILLCISLINNHSNDRVLQNDEETSTGFVFDSPCSDETVCGYFGNCIKNKCYCFLGYISVDDVQIKSNIDDIHKGKYCNYKKKYQINAFLLELFLGFGVGHLYSGRYANGILKLICIPLALFMIYFYALSVKCIDKGTANNKEIRIFFVTMSFFLVAMGIAFWIVFDAINFGLNKYTDGNGVELVSWGM